uniref:Cysteine proteinase 3, putative n=1 Tax=Entamoeba invadens TaxID=33085 RepID=S0B3R9_ENTIV|nr:cysteine proteinase 3 precursor, putative [Entamoeba invadens]
MFCLLIAIAAAADFNAWKLANKKHFSLAENLRRRAIFNKNAKFVEAFNKQHSFELSVDGPFAAHTNAEYQAMLKPIHYEPFTGKSEVPKSVPESVDWRAQGKVPAVRDQAQCGSCYTFSALASVENRLLIAGSKRFTVDTMDLSEQQLVDCSTSVGNNGCSGGSLVMTFRYIKTNGIMAESDYKYTATETTCAYDKTKVVAHISGQKSIAQGDEAALTAAAVEGVVSVAIDASRASFQLYKKGVYDEAKCSSTQLDHGVAVVGYGVQDGSDYYIVRNSWGASWGLDGYILMSRNKNNQCGIATGAVYPTGVTDA